MRRSTHRGSRIVGRGQRRKLIWGTTQVQTFNVPANTGHVFDLLSVLEVAGASTLGITIMRTHVRMQINLGASGDFLQIGLLIGRDADVGLAVPTPFNEPELDWMWDTVEFARASGAAIDSPFTVEYDVRSKRKMEELNQRYLLCVYNSAAAAHNVSYFVRTLVALP